MTPTGFEPLHIKNSQATATIYRHGAHVAAFQPTGQRPVLFMSAKSWFEPNKPIRGGVPVIFPWFGPHATDTTQPAHGLARLSDWDLTSHDDHGVTLLKELAGCRLTYRVRVGAALEMNLEVHNGTATPFRFEEALHTYFAVSDCRQCKVTGLEDTRYDSKVENVTGQRQDGAITFTAETDRMYLNTTATCVIHDTGWNRRIIVEKSGSNATVVWNPWIAKAKAMPDFGDDEWPFMICIEAANARAHAVTLAPGQTHTLRQAIRIEPA